jgi:opacity protein-like surface antigen
LFRIWRAIVFSLLLSAVVGTPVVGHAQVAPSVYGGGANFWTGTEYSYFDSDLAGPTKTGGIGVYAIFNRDAHWSAEVSARFMSFTPSDAGVEQTYMTGPRYMLHRRGRLQPYVKALVGVGKINFPNDLGHGSYFIYAPGGGAEYAVRPRLSIRVDYVYEFWPSAPGIPNLPSHGVTPHGFSVGASYRVFRAGGTR